MPFCFEVVSREHRCKLVWQPCVPLGPGPTTGRTRVPRMNERTTACTAKLNRSD
jgi:hypothetical protein